MKVSLFVTCLTDLFFAQVGMAVVKTLEHFGCTVDFPLRQTCCGQPQFNNGYPQEAATLALRMIEVFKDADYVITPSGSCCAMIREHYAGLFANGSTRQTEAAKLAGRTYEFIEFLTKILKVDLSAYRLPEPLDFTYHYTCHLRGLGATGKECVGLLTQIGNCRHAPLEKSEQCCGFGGTFAAKYPDISGAIVRDKVACGKRSGATVMIVNDGGCAMNIGGACHRYGGSFAVRHAAEVIAAAVTGEPLA